MSSYSTPAKSTRGFGNATHFKPILFTLCIFLSGTVVGSVVTSRYAWKQTLHVLFTNPQVATEDILLQTKTGLHLSATQSEQIDAAFQKFQARMKGLRLETAPRVGQGLDDLQRDVAQVLDAEQAAEWGRRFQEMKKRFFPPSDEATR